MRAGLLLSAVEAELLAEVLTIANDEWGVAQTGSHRHVLQEVVDRWRTLDPGRVVIRLLETLEAQHAPEPKTGLCPLDGQVWPCSTAERILVAQGEVQELVAGLYAARTPEPDPEPDGPGPTTMHDRVRHWRDRNGLEVLDGGAADRG